MTSCGTSAGYDRHRRRGETPCDSCRLTHNAYMREYKMKRQGGPKPVRLAVCGTRSAYNRHLRYGESCDECRAANTEASRANQRRYPELYARERVKPRYIAYQALYQDVCKQLKRELGVKGRVSRKTAPERFDELMKANRAAS